MSKKTEQQVRITIQVPLWLAKWLRGQPRKRRKELIREALIRQHDLEREGVGIDDE
jgi:hypothetical protein